MKEKVEESNVDDGEGKGTETITEAKDLFDSVPGLRESMDFAKARAEETVAAKPREDVKIGTCVACQRHDRLIAKESGVCTTGTAQPIRPDNCVNRQKAIKARANR